MKKWDNGALYATEKDVIDADSRIVVVKTYSCLTDSYHDTYVSFPQQGTNRDDAIYNTISNGMKLSKVTDYLKSAKHQLEL